MENSAHSNNPWFVVSIGLMGLMLGYGLASLQGGVSSPGDAAAANVLAQNNNQSVPAAPTVPDEEVPAGEPVPPVDPETDHIRGNPDAKVSIIEYSDYECPFCKRHHPTMVQLLKDYPNDVNWVYRHYPLSFHPNAQPAAEAAECVAEIGGNDKFWEFSDKLMGSESYDYAAIVKELGLSEQKFTECFSSGKHKQFIADQMNAGATAGVSGTPGNFVLNNETQESQFLSGAYPVTNFKSMIDAILAE